jgi:penicillin amidase
MAQALKGVQRTQLVVRACFLAVVVGLVGVFLLTGFLGFLLFASLPTLDGNVQLAGLTRPVIVDTDERSIPRIKAENRLDVYRALGFAHANERLFQMDLLRRRSAGELAEIFGSAVIEEDKWHKVMGFAHVADAILVELPVAQREALRAYAQGINAALSNMSVPPWEFVVLGYRPRPWRVEDSLLVILGLYERLSWSGPEERVATVIEKAFSTRVAEFFFPAQDCYTKSLFGTPIDQCHLDPPPVHALRTAGVNQGVAVPSPEYPLVRLRKGGSNAWVVAPGKSNRNRAILANDMHLDLTVPNIWYRVSLEYPNTKITGLTLPGLPLILSGSNQHIAWGFTNISGDFSDLILLDKDSENEQSYQTPDGLRHFTQRREVIHVRGGTQVPLSVEDTIWGPVLPQKLFDKAVAVRWTALDPKATDIRLLDLDSVASVAEALTFFNQAGGPGLNALVADNKGNIGWTYVGRIPIRVGFDGLVAKSWSKGTHSWQGYIPPSALPRMINPPSGFIVSANQRMTGADYPYLIAPHFDSGFRAYRITQRLKDMERLTERDMLALQLDTESEFYRYYQRLAIAALDRNTDSGDAFHRALRRHLAAWDGKAEPGSLGLAVLVQLQELMAEALFTPILEHCRTVDPQFQWRFYREASLRQLLDARPLELLPKDKGGDWDDFIVKMVKESARRIMAQLGTDSLNDLSWDKVNLVAIRHPLSTALPPWIGSWIDMPVLSLPGCEECVRWTRHNEGATERLVVSPGNERDAIFEMPTGQSGHPFSGSYRDQHKDWIAGAPRPFLVGRGKHILTLEPANEKPMHGS